MSIKIEYILAKLLVYSVLTLLNQTYTTFGEKCSMCVKPQTMD